MRKDVDLNFTAHPLTGDLVVKTGIQAIEQAMKNLVLTDFYERGYNIPVGSNVKGSLFENITPLTEQTLKDNIIQVLENFEPNVEIIDVIVKAEANTLYVYIYYNAFNDPEIRIASIPLKRLR